MAATFRISGVNNFGHKMARFVIMTPDNSYPTGGYRILGSQADLPILGGIGVMDVVSASGYIWTVDRATTRIKAMQCPAGGGVLTEVAAGTDMSAEGVGLLCIQG